MKKSIITRSSLCLLTMFCISMIIAQTACSQNMREGGRPHGPDMRSMDSNQDRKVSKKEWLAFHKTLFSKMDKNSDGYLVDSELTRPGNSEGGRESGGNEGGMNRRQGPPPLSVSTIDKDGDNKVSYSEWKSFHSANFKKMDKNSDGYLTKDDMGKPQGR